MMEAETTPQQPTTTTMIRSSDPDLTIIVGKGEQQKIYECHSPIMAMYSQYIDSMLATPMREQKTRTISFSEIDSADWESMIGYLQAGVPPQTLDQVCAVLPFYDKYEFQSGLAICDRMLAAFDFDVDANLDQCMVAVEMVYKYAQRFPIAKAKATACVRTVFASHARMFCLEKEHICRLVPALREDESLWTLAVKKALNPFDTNLNSEMYLASAFLPEVLERSIKALANGDALRQTRASIEVTGAGAVEANGTYVYEKQRGGSYWYAKRTASPSQEASHFIRRRAMRNTGLPGWIIFRARGPPRGDGIPVPTDDRSILYVRQMSRNVGVPPTHGWKPFVQTIPSPAPILRFG